MIGFLPLLGVLFIGLKLLGHIDWSWWWVLLPIYGMPVVVFIFSFIAVACGVAIAKR